MKARKIQKALICLEYLSIVISIAALVKAATEENWFAVLGWLCAVLWTINCLIRDI